MKVIERSTTHNYKVEENKDYKKLISPNANYIFDKRDGITFSWGKTFKEDPECFPGPVIADIEITTGCLGLKGDGNSVCSFCFPEDTEISLPGGDTRSINTIQKGDRVLSYNIKEKKTTINEVEEVYKRRYEDILVTLELEDGTKVSTTLNHPFYVKNIGWVEAQNLIEGEDIQTLGESLKKSSQKF